MNIYWFNWPSPIGGADTKFAHLLRLLRSDYKITVVPNDASYLQTEWTAELQSLGIAIKLMQELPETLDGWAISLCNKFFFVNGMAAEMKRRGLRVVWSGEMMWHFSQEEKAIQSGLIDKILYVSDAQRVALEPGYQSFVDADSAGEGEEPWFGCLEGKRRSLPWVNTGNYIDPELFPFVQRGNRPPSTPFAIGRLSRPDPTKFPDDFPKFYERLGLENPVKFRVMAWSDELTERWSEHHFDERWELLPPASIPTVEFLHSLDLLVYNTSQRFQESWGRAVVESMLTGAVPILPKGQGHHLEKLVEHGVSGFLCDNPIQYGSFARMLQESVDLLKKMSLAAHLHAKNNLCNSEEHRRWWQKVFQ